MLELVSPATAARISAASLSFSVGSDDRRGGTNRFVGMRGRSPSSNGESIGFRWVESNGLCRGDDGDAIGVIDLDDEEEFASEGSTSIGESIPVKSVNAPEDVEGR